MIGRLVVPGATGDLSGRFLMPALAALHAAGHLDEGFRLTGASREELTTEWVPGVDHRLARPAGR
ncbi:hypothetical protein ACFY7F_07530 [Streptomyces griseofuscus]|uniref:hypothetical protein n=1 Tax=Streptomyces griseofuscus TaxID=146922 RepID=UPI0036C5569B